MGRGDYQEMDDALRGIVNLNGVISTADLNGLWNVTPGDPFTDLQDFDTANAWDEISGGTVSLQNGLNVLETDGTQADSRTVLETSNLGVYRAGTQVRVAGGFTTADPPTGNQYYEWGYGRAGGQSHVFFRDTADDLQIRAENEVSGEKVVSRSAGHLDPGTRTELDASGNEVEDGSEVLRVYGVDPLDGTGPSNINYDRTEGYLTGFIIGWYAPTVTVPFIVGMGDVAGEWRERVFPLCVLEPVGEPLFSRPNEPWKWEANNGGSAPGAGAGLRFPTGGRQFSYDGNISAGREDVVHQTQRITIPLDGTGTTVDLPDGSTRDYYVLAVAKRRPNSEETAVSLGEISFLSNNDLLVHARVIPESDLTGTLDYTEPSDTHAESSYVQIDAQPDTPGRVTVDAAEIDGRTRLLGKSWGGRLVSGSGQNNKFTIGEANEFRLQFVRNNPVVLVGTTVDGNSATFTANIGLPGVQ